ATATAGEFSATINWGDGTTSAGTVTADANGGFDVKGSRASCGENDWFGVLDGWGIHFNLGNRHFVVRVTITDTQTQDQAKTESLAPVAPTPPNLAVTAQNVEGTSGQAISGVVATFTDVHSGTTASSYTATINWGDGTTSAGVVTADPKGGFDV